MDKVYCFKVTTSIIDMRFRSGNVVILGGGGGEGTLDFISANYYFKSLPKVRVNSKFLKKLFVHISKNNQFFKQN